jgi:hypothetical protein
VGRYLSAIASNGIPDIEENEPIFTLRSVKIKDYPSGSFFAPETERIECHYTHTVRRIKNV